MTNPTTSDNSGQTADKPEGKEPMKQALKEADDRSYAQGIYRADPRYWEAQASAALQSANVEGLVEALRAWEAWEAKLLLDGRAWQTDDGCLIPQDLFDEYVCGPQSLRAAALTHTKEASNG